MTSVIVSETKGNINSIEISGHADFANHGEDIVCEAISTIAFGTLNALAEFKVLKQGYIVDENNALIKILFDNDNTSQIIAKTAVIQLKTIQNIHSEYIQIK